ncbi:hypothetical protein R1flu_007510 [Riccia fluitans]|uniref:Uncharacterized protein n=1 Tax=Riccia fluitans TaxID=41844 RepID=A0ABD1YZ26_9MARC
MRAGPRVWSRRGLKVATRCRVTWLLNRGLPHPRRQTVRGEADSLLHPKQVRSPTLTGLRDSRPIRVEASRRGHVAPDGEVADRRIRGAGRLRGMGEIRHV